MPAGDLGALSSALNIHDGPHSPVGPGRPIKTENRTALNANNMIDVMVVGGVMTPEDWAAPAKAQQEASPVVIEA